MEQTTKKSSVFQSTDDLWVQILGDTEKAAPFRKQYGAEAWSRLKKLIGREAALELVEMSRNDILRHLRIEYGFTLQAVADVFGITRERVRQLTPSGLWHKNAEGIDWYRLAHRVATIAVRNKAAWTPKGRIKREWVVERFGDDLAYQVGDLQDKFNKLVLILQFRLGLSDENSCLQWINQQYYGEERTYADIARKLSEYIPISTMCVYRNAQELGFRGYSKGRRHDLDL
jgi:hypothetical protein